MLAGRAEAMQVEMAGSTVTAAAQIKNGTAYVPIRDLLGAFDGWELSWDNSKRTAKAAGPVFSLELPAGSSQIRVSGADFDLGAGTYLYGGSLYVPLRTVANLCGSAVTWNGSQRPITMEPAGTGTYTEEDLYWLSRIISAESQGEPLLGQLAVGNVVLNRVAHKNYPGTIHGVIFDQVGGPQFTPTVNGAIYWEPTAQSIMAARMVLNGTSVVGECLFFYAPALSNDTWISANRVFYATIGCHNFYL